METTQKDFATKGQYLTAVASYMTVFRASISQGITYKEKEEMDELEKKIRASRFFE